MMIWLQWVKTTYVNKAGKYSDLLYDTLQVNKSKLQLKSPRKGSRENSNYTTKQTRQAEIKQANTPTAYRIKRVECYRIQHVIDYDPQYIVSLRCCISAAVFRHTITWSRLIKIKIKNKKDRKTDSRMKLNNSRLYTNIDNYKGNIYPGRSQARGVEWSAECQFYL